jgi:iron complex transport system permease protein
MVGIAILLAVLFVAALLRLHIGESFGWPKGSFFKALFSIYFGEFQVEDGASAWTGILQIRLMRVIVAILAGCALATSGVALQNLLRNPLAEPFILGLSSGAAVGYVTQRMASRLAETSLGAGYVGATCGALVVMALVYVGGRKRGVVDPLGMLLVGVIVSTLCGAILMVFWQIAVPGEMTDAARWSMGSLEESLGPLEISVATVLRFVCLIWLWFRHSAMDVALLSDGEAMSLGLNLKSHRTLLFVTGALLAAAAVVLAGPLAFVGLVCPHLARLMFGQRHRFLIPAAAVVGAVLVLGADIAVVAVKTEKVQVFPIGIFTVLIGGPIFFSMLRKQLGRGGE